MHVGGFGVWSHFWQLQPMKTKGEGELSILEEGNKAAFLGQGLRTPSFIPLGSKQHGLGDSDFRWWCSYYRKNGKLFEQPRGLMLVQVNSLCYRDAHAPVPAASQAPIPSGRTTAAFPLQYRCSIRPVHNRCLIV